jgi:Enoyl-(Acyl carrier protein) reductase
VTVGEQVQDAIAGAVTIVRQHHVRVEQRRCAVDEDHGQAGSAFGQEVTLVVTGRDKDQSVDPPCDEGRRQLDFSNGILVQAAGENRYTARAGDVLDGPMQRYASPEEIAPTVVYLASDTSSFMTGSVVVIDGGYTLF